MNNKKVVFRLLITVTMLFVAAFAYPIPTSAEVIRLKMSHINSARHVYQTKVLEPWAQMIKERTDGRVTIAIYPMKAIVNAPDTYDAVVGGLIDIGEGAPAYTWGRFPLTSVVELPMIGITSSEMGSKILMQLYEKHAAFKEEYRDVKLLWLFIGDPMQFHTRKKPIKTIEDLKGMKFRSPGGIITKAQEKLGLRVVSMPVTEIYNSLERGLIDGITFGWSGMSGFRFNEVTKYHTSNDFTTISFFHVMNKKKWDSLPSDIQKIIDEISGMTGAILASKPWDVAAANDKIATKKQGHSLYTMPSEEVEKWREIVKPLWDEWAEDMESKGLPGREILEDTLKLIKEYK